MERLQTRVLRIAASLPKGSAVRREILAAVRDAGFGGDSVVVKLLPPGVQKALKSVGYSRRDISVRADATPPLSDAGGDGRRAFFMAVDIISGRILHEATGSWGGANPFSPKNKVDLGDENYTLQSGQAAIKGSEGGGVYATVYYHPSDKNVFLPDTEVASVTPDEKKALNVLSMVSGYRADGWQREDLPGRLSLDNPIVQSLLAKKLIQTNRAGAISLTTAGKNAR